LAVLLVPRVPPGRGGPPAGACGRGGDGGCGAWAGGGDGATVPPVGSGIATCRA